MAQIELNGFLRKMRSIKGLKLTDPWRTECRVERIDWGASMVWVSYPDKDVWFPRHLADLFAASCCQFRDDPENQFILTATLSNGLGLTLEY